MVPEGHEMWLRSQLLFARMAISLSSFRNCSCHLLPLDVPASFWKVGNSSSIISLLEGQMGFESQQTAPCLLNKNQEKLEWKKKSNNGENKGYISKIFPFLWAQQRSLSSFEERQVGGWQVHFL